MEENEDENDRDTMNMNAARILPELQASLLCEEVRQEANGNLFIIGVINLIRVPQLPVVAARLCVFNRWTSGVGRFAETTRLLAPDGMSVLGKGETKFELPGPAAHAVNLMAFVNVEFKIAGTYFLEVLVDDVMKIRAPLSVVLAPPPARSAVDPVAERTGVGP
jgi:hypothetical protein